MYAVVNIYSYFSYVFYQQVLYKLKKYLKDPNFVPEKVAHYSVACQSFCQWVLAINHYCKVCQVVKPKRELHKKISVDLDFVVGQLQAKEVQLKEVYLVYCSLAGQTCFCVIEV